MIMINHRKGSHARDVIESRRTVGLFISLFALYLSAHLPSPASISPPHASPWPPVIHRRCIIRARDGSFDTEHMRETASTVSRNHRINASIVSRNHRINASIVSRNHRITKSSNQLVLAAIAAASAAATLAGFFAASPPTASACALSKRHLTSARFNFASSHLSLAACYPQTLYYSRTGWKF